MRMKVALIIERADTSLGGAERSMFELATAISVLGPEVNVLAAKGQAKTANTRILCGDGEGNRANYFEFAGALRKHLSANHYDIIHSALPFDFVDIYHPRGGTYAESILRNAASYHNRFVASFKRLTAFSNRRRSILLRAERRLCRQPAGPVIVAISQYVAEQLKQHYRTDAERIVIIPNGVEIAGEVDSKTASTLRGQILRSLGVQKADDAVLLLFAANNFRLKGLTVLIKALYLTARHNLSERRACLVVAGNGKPAKYVRLAGRLGVDNRIIFLGSVAQIQELLSVANVAVLPTFYDPSSRFILEAIAMGRPVVTTRFNGATDLFVNGRHGKVIESPENAAELAQAIEHFTNREHIEQASRAIAADNLRETVSIKRVAGQLMNVYESISRRKGQPLCTRSS